MIKPSQYRIVNGSVLNLTKAFIPGVYHYEFHGKPLNRASNPYNFTSNHVYVQPVHTHTDTLISGKWLEHNVSITEAVGLHRFTVHKSHPYSHIKLPH